MCKMVLNIRGGDLWKKKYDCAGKRVYKGVSFVIRYGESADDYLKHILTR